METEEKQILKEIYDNFKSIYYKQKAIDDLFMKILKVMPDNKETADIRKRFKINKNKLAKVDIKAIEERINNL